jgi:single-strand DNA-binding protein
MQTITIAGNIGKDAETRQTQAGSVTSFSVGVSNGRDKETTWYRCSLWGARGEKLASYLTKGSKVTVAGRFTAGTYEGKPDLKIDVAEVTLQGGKQDGGNTGNGSRTRAPAGDDLDDDVPFITMSAREPGTSKRVL